MKRFSLVSSIALVIVLIATQSAFAARIYNFLPVKVHATGMLGNLSVNQVTLEPGARSESISWSAATVARFDLVKSQGSYNSRDTPLCQLLFGFHAEVQGGNYMTVGVYKGKVFCALCGSDHKVVHQVSGIGVGWKETRTGC